jgi:ribonucleoside-triphosphate reductase
MKNEGSWKMTCKHRTEVYSRVVGYYRPVQQWNKGKQAEYEDRLPFKLTGVIGPHAAVVRNAAPAPTRSTSAPAPAFAAPLA